MEKLSRATQIEIIKLQGKLNKVLSQMEELGVDHKEFPGLFAKANILRHKIKMRKTLETTGRGLVDNFLCF